MIATIRYDYISKSRTYGYMTIYMADDNIVSYSGIRIWI